MTRLSLAASTISTEINLGVVHAQDAFNLGEQPCEKSQVASGHTNQARYDFGVRPLSGRVTPGGVQHRSRRALYLGSAKRPELMNEADTRVELRKASDALLDAGHAD
jgi:hypothetical protein